MHPYRGLEKYKTVEEAQEKERKQYENYENYKNRFYDTID